ncbi:MAG TPA: glycosyltransferase family 2 protein [Dehalococcoidia bacterium]|nr:glycosyltransferase family 2 protein [Dehalococcoidia bacterium]
MTVKVSLITVNYNGQACLGELFESLARQTQPPDEVIMVDNASTDSSVAYVRKRFPWVNVIVSPTNVGFAEGTNIGAANAQGDYLALLNPDTVVDERWLEELVRALDRDARVGATVPKISLAGGDHILDCAGAEFNNLGFCWGRGSNQPDRGQFDTPTEVPGATACAMLLRHEALGGAPVFDGRFFMYYEELELSLRIRGRGYTIRYVPTAIVYHKRAQAVKKAARQPTLFHQFYCNRNRVKILAKYYPAAVLFRSLPLILLSLAYWNSVFLLRGGPVFFSRAVLAQTCAALEGFRDRLHGKTVCADLWLPWMKEHSLRDILDLRRQLGAYIE